MPARPHDVLVRRRLIRGIRARVRFELANKQDVILNEVESAALEAFDTTLAAGGDYELVADELLSAPLNVHAAIEV